MHAVLTPAIVYGTHFCHRLAGRKSSRLQTLRKALRQQSKRDFSPETMQLFQKAATGLFWPYATWSDLNFKARYYGWESEDVWLSAQDVLNYKWPDLLSRTIKLKAAMACICHNRPEEAIRLIQDIGLRYIAKNARFLELCYFITQHIPLDECDHYEIVRASRLYQSAIKYGEDFADKIKNSNGDFCIVGNAPTETGRGNGKKIDSFKTVIRINNYGTNMPDDYGTKEDVWIRVANQEITKPHIRNNQTVIFARHNFLKSCNRAADYLLEPYLMEKAYTAIPSSTFCYLIRELECLPSTGMAIIYWIYSLYGQMDKNQIFGFSHINNSKDFHTHYFSDGAPRGQYHRHDWLAETNLMGEIVR